MRFAVTLAALALSFSASAGEMPFVKSSKSPDELAGALASAGFEVVGEYTPYEGTRVVAFTSPALKAAAGKTEFGGYAAVLRVAVEGDEVSYNNPTYQAGMYQLEGDLAGVKADLAEALGDAGQFGAEEARSAKELRKYHFMAFMPYFDDGEKLAEMDSQAQALETIDKNLEKGVAGASKVYEVQVAPQTTLIGIAIGAGDGADETVMNTVATSAAHLPYEILVKDGTAYMLHPKFRIAMSAPDLSMGGFMKISKAPGAIIDVGEALTR